MLFLVLRLWRGSKPVVFVRINIYRIGIFDSTLFTNRMRRLIWARRVERDRCRHVSRFRPIRGINERRSRVGRGVNRSDGGQAVLGTRYRTTRVECLFTLSAAQGLDFIRVHGGPKGGHSSRNSMVSISSIMSRPLADKIDEVRTLIAVRHSRVASLQL